MKNNTDITKFQITSLLDDWRFFHKAIGDLNRQRFVDVSVDEVVVWNQTADHTVTAILSATHADYIQVVQRLLGSQANNELESISLRVSDGASSNVTEGDAELTMADTPKRTGIPIGGYCENGLMFNEDKTIYGGWN